MARKEMVKNSPMNPFPETSEMPNPFQQDEQPQERKQVTLQELSEMELKALIYDCWELDAENKNRISEINKELERRRG